MKNWLPGSCFISAAVDDDKDDGDGNNGDDDDDVIIFIRIGLVGRRCFMVVPRGTVDHPSVRLRAIPLSERRPKAG
jgi:hypothetical protein